MEFLEEKSKQEGIALHGSSLILPFRAQSPLRFKVSPAMFLKTPCDAT